MGHGLQHREIVVQFPVRGKRHFFFFKTSSHPLVRTQLPFRWFSWAPSQGRGKQLGLEALQLYTVPRVTIPVCRVYVNSASCIHCVWTDKFSFIEVINFSIKYGLVSRYPYRDQDPYSISSYEEMQLFPEGAATEARFSPVKSIQSRH